MAKQVDTLKLHACALVDTHTATHCHTRRATKTPAKRNPQVGRYNSGTAYNLTVPQGMGRLGLQRQLVPTAAAAASCWSGDLHGRVARAGCRNSGTRSYRLDTLYSGEFNRSRIVYY